MSDTEELLAVWVTALNNDGERRDGYGYGNTSDEAVQNAVDVIREQTGDDTYVMDEWEAA